MVAHGVSSLTSHQHSESPFLKVPRIKFWTGAHPVVWGAILGVWGGGTHIGQPTQCGFTGTRSGEVPRGQSVCIIRGEKEMFSRSEH